MSFLSYQHFPIYSVMALFLGAFLVVLFGRNKFLRGLIAFCATAIALCCMILLIKPVMLNHEIICYWMGSRAMAGGYAIGIAMEVDQVSLFFGLLIATAVFVACVYSLQYMDHDDNIPEYYTLFLMLAGGVMGLVLSGDLFNMFIMVEILTFAAVALTAFRNKAFGALEAAFKYLVVGCMGSTAILTGTIMLYAQAHTLNFAQLSDVISGNMNTTTIVAFALLYIGFSTKAFIVPFHPLAADAHGAAPASISVLISGVLTKSGVYAILRLTYFLFQTMQLGAIQFMLVFIGSVSMFVFVTMALAPHDFKRLLAFHSISQIGYVMTAIGLGTGLGLSAGLYHAMNHTMFKGLLFLAAGAVHYRTGVTDLRKLGGLGKKMPWTCALFLIGAASISGIPPFNGFASKWMIYQATYQKAVESGNIGFLLATIVALITSVLTLASFVKVTQSVFFGQIRPEHEDVKEVPAGMIIAMCLFAAICVVTGLFPRLVTDFLTGPAANAALNPQNYISSMLTGEGVFKTYEVFAGAGVWSPVNWLLLLMIALLGVTIVAVLGKYDQVSESKEGELVDSKFALFFGGEQTQYSQVGGEDLFWGLKHNWRHYFSFMHELHSGVVNDYALWAVVALALAIVFLQIAL